MKAALLIVGFLMITQLAPAQVNPQRASTEKKFVDLDMLRREAEALKKIGDELEKVVLQLVRTRGAMTDEDRKVLNESKLTYCQKEAFWRQEFTKLETSLKKTSGGNLPTWVTQDRNWQKLDIAMKKDTVSVSPEECKEIYSAIPVQFRRS